VSEGLREHGQREIVFSLVRPPGTGVEDAAREPLQLLAAIARLAREGRLVDEGGCTEVGPAGLFGHPALRGVVYQAARPLDGVDVPGGALAAVALVAPEMDTARRFGALRVLARLGRAHRFFPTAVWCDPGRAPAMAAEAGSVLERVASAQVPGVSVVTSEDRVTLRVARSAQETLARGLATLPAEVPLALLTSLDPDADGCLVWSPGQNAPEAISAPGGRGARLSGCFALFASQQAADAVNPFEDGFAILLTAASWARVRQALAQGRPLEIPGSRSFGVEWVDRAS
jgi:hypothetical protein